MEARATSFFLLPPFNLTLNHEWWVIHIFAFSDLYIVWPWFFFSEGELLRVLADLHGGDRTHEEVVLEYEEIKQQVTICTTCNLSPFCRFTSSALKERNSTWTYWNRETLVASCSGCACKCGPNFVVWTSWCTSSWSDGWPSRLTFFENTGTTSSTSSKTQVLRVVAITLSPTWVNHYTTAHFPLTAPHSNSQYNTSSMLLPLLNRNIFLPHTIHQSFS